MCSRPLRLDSRTQFAHWLCSRCLERISVSAAAAGVLFMIADAWNAFNCRYVQGRSHCRLGRTTRLTCSIILLCSGCGAPALLLCKGRQDSKWPAVPHASSLISHVSAAAFATLVPWICQCNATPQVQCSSGFLTSRNCGEQVDEPALREGLPLKRERWESYLDWAVRAFRLATVVAAPSTQIVTHLCYSEFADILPVRS